jgi:hypothetical protein
LLFNSRLYLSDVRVPLALLAHDYRSVLRASQSPAGEIWPCDNSRCSSVGVRDQKLNALDKLFWVIVPRIWSEWKNSLIVVTPETVVRWHRAGFRFYWKLISRVRQPIGRERLPKEVRDPIFRMVAENAT